MITPPITKPLRSSNIELLRIVSMFIIVLCHYNVNSGLIGLVNTENIDFNTLMVQFCSIGGKIGVNAFFLITGYFMCRTTMRWEKLIQFGFQILSVQIIVYCFLIFQGKYYTSMDYVEIIPFMTNIPVSFVATYVVLYSLSGVINTGLAAMSKKQMTLLLAVLLMYFSVMPLIPLAGDTWHYLGWGFTMYALGTYIRRFDMTRYNLPYGLLTLLFVALTWAAIYAFDIISEKYTINSYDWKFFMSDGNKLNIFLIALCMFMFFARLKMRYHKWINAIGGSVCFGVLLWHATGAPMRQWLWRDTLDNVGYFSSPYLWLHCICSVMAVYIICTLLELIRQRLIQRPFDAWLSRIADKKKNVRHAIN